MTAIPQATAIDGYRWLKNDIIRGVYQPDEKLRMSLLTSRYELGVGPLREALSQLVAERLVTVVNQKGYRVASMSEAELLDIFDARANMEAMLVRLAIERGGDEWEAELLARAHLLNKLESSEASERLLDEWDQRHQAFHTAIVAGCGSQYLLQMRERLFDLAARYRFIWLRTTVLSVEMLEDKHVQHQTLLEAILARDAERASALMREHLLTPSRLSNRRWPANCCRSNPDSGSGLFIIRQLRDRILVVFLHHATVRRRHSRVEEKVLLTVREKDQIVAVAKAGYPIGNMIFGLRLTHAGSHLEMVAPLHGR